MRRVPALLIGLVLLLCAGCASDRVSRDELFPVEVGDYLRTAGPSIEAGTGVDVASYEGPHGAVILRIRQVSPDQVETAVNTLPPGASGVGYDAGMGRRDGVFFNYGGEFHAAWANQSWVFVISASTDTARRAFIAAYGF